MAGKVLNIKVCSPLKLRSGLIGNKPAICHYSYNLPLATNLKTEEMKYSKLLLKLEKWINVYPKSNNCNCDF